MRVYEWDRDWEQVIVDHRHTRFVAIDPGKYGALVTEDGDPYRLTDWENLDFGLTIIEGQYVGVNPKAALRLSFGAGLLCGQMGRDVLIVQPSVWQRILPLVKGRAALAKEASHMATKALGSKIPLWSNKALEGVHAAACIREWWTWARQSAGDAM